MRGKEHRYEQRTPQPIPRVHKSEELESFISGNVPERSWQHNQERTDRQEKDPVLALDQQDTEYVFQVFPNCLSFFLISSALTHPVSQEHYQTSLNSFS